MDIISNLPNEILSDILDYIPLHDSFGDIRTCCLVSKKFNAVASRILYRHINISSCSGSEPNEKVTRALLLPDHQSIQYIRKISVKTTRPALKTWASRVRDMSILLNQIIEAVGEDKIDYIHLDSERFFQYLSISRRKKVKSLEVCLLYNEQQDRLRKLIYDLPPSESLADFEKFAQDTAFEALEINMIGGDVATFLSAWKICEQNLRTLRSLLLSGNMKAPVKCEGISHLLPKSHRLEALEELSLYDFPVFSQNTGNFDITEELKSLTAVYVPENIKRFNLFRYSGSPRLNVSWMCGMTNLAELNIRISGPLSGLEELLFNLPQGLSSLYANWIAEEGTSVFPRKSSFNKHSQTLKRLWLGSQPGNLGTWFEIPVSTHEGSEDLDIKTISEFPLLEHLGVAISKPDSWTSWAPRFPSLKSIVFIHSQPLRPQAEIPRNLEINYYSYEVVERIIPKISDAMKDWLNWIVSPYQDIDRDSNTQNEQEQAHMALLAITITIEPMHFGYTEEHWKAYRSYFRDRSKPYCFDPSPKKLDLLGYWYPEAWDFGRTGMDIPRNASEMKI